MYNSLGALSLLCAGRGGKLHHGAELTILAGQQGGSELSGEELQASEVIGITTSYQTVKPRLNCSAKAAPACY